MRATPKNIWLGAGVFSLLVLGIGAYLFVNTSRSVSEESPVVPTILNVTVPTALPPNGSNSLPPTVEIPKLKPVDYPLGSVGDACEVNGFPPYHWEPDLDQQPLQSFAKDPYSALENEECFSALERHIFSVNPYLWGAQDEKRISHNRVFSFVVINNPLTFERIFTDPAGDLARVQDALSRPECQLGQDAESNWKLNETCHSSAILNYALLTRFCYGVGVKNRDRQYYWEKDDPTPEQDRSMWIQRLEGRWLRRKCKTLDPNLNLHSELHTELRNQIHSLQSDKNVIATLIELASRLGDDAAALTSEVFRPYTQPYTEEGYKFGPLANMFTNVFDPTKLAIKHPPSVDRLRQIIPLFSKNIGASGGRFVIFDHEALVQHLCTPPYYSYPSRVDIPTAPEPPSCRNVAADLRLQYQNDEFMLELIATFEDVAMRLDVYE